MTIAIMYTFILELVVMNQFWSLIFLLIETEKSDTNRPYFKETLNRLTALNPVFQHTFFQSNCKK